MRIGAAGRWGALALVQLLLVACTEADAQRPTSDPSAPTTSERDESGGGTGQAQGSSPADPHLGLRIENATGAPISLVLRGGTTATVTTESFVVVLRCAARMPIRALDEDGRLIAVRGGSCRGDTWVVTDRESDSGRLALTPLRAPRRVDGLRWARSNVPRSVPEPEVDLPSLLADPPGQALVASYVPRDSDGLEDEAVDFYGIDGHWRRLDLGDLDVPRAGFSGGDTYGAGALSPDGRWWAGPLQGGMVLVDLRTGTSSVRRVKGEPSTPLFTWSPDSDEVLLVLSSTSRRVSVPGLRARPGSRAAGYPLGDGRWRGCTPTSGVVTHCDTYDPDGELVERREIPRDLRTRYARPLDEVGDSVFYALPSSQSDHPRKDWEVVQTDSAFHARARLVVPGGGEINMSDAALGPSTLVLAALDEPLLVAWLADRQTLVKLVRPGLGELRDHEAYDLWQVAFARDLVRVG